MEQVKIDNFIRENTRKDFPSYTPIANQECIDIRFSLAKNLMLSPLSDNATLVNEVDKKGKICSGIRGDSHDFDLKKVFSSLDICWSDYVYLNWYRYDDIDKMKFIDIANYFDDLWYPDADDIDIFDETLTWIFSVSHSGQIKILKM